MESKAKTKEALQAVASAVSEPVPEPKQSEYVRVTLEQMEYKQFYGEVFEVLSRSDGQVMGMWWRW